MGMITCRDCGSPVSAKAERCPKCGRPTPNQSRAEAVTVIVVLIILVIGVLYVATGGAGH